MSTPETVGYDKAREIVEQVKESRDVIALTRVGAKPYLRYTPYENNEGVTIGMWSCISYSFERAPERTLLPFPHIVRPWELDDWEINQIHTPWVVNQVANTWGSRVEVLPAEESPFVGELLRWDDAP